MSSEQVESFIEAVRQNAALEAEVTSATSPAEVVEIASRQGFTITTEDLNAPEDVVTDAELAGAAGGLVLLSFAICPSTGRGHCHVTYSECSEFVI